MANAAEDFVIQPDLSNNISIMRNNDHSSIEQPLVVTSGFREDTKQPSDERGLLKFDISSLPQNRIVEKAILQLYVLGVNKWEGEYWKPLSSLSRTIDIYRITTFWEGWSFTYWSYSHYPTNEWDNSGGDFTGPTDSVFYQIPGTWNRWTVTEDVTLWYSGLQPNYGWLLKDVNEGDVTGYKVEYNNWFYVISVEYSPKLVVTLRSSPRVSLSPVVLACAFYSITLLSPVIFYIIRKKTRQL